MAHRRSIRTASRPTGPKTRTIMNRMRTAFAVSLTMLPLAVSGSFPATAAPPPAARGVRGGDRAPARDRTDPLGPGQAHRRPGGPAEGGGQARDAQRPSDPADRLPV